jgi:hypothetical protein
MFMHNLCPYVLIISTSSDINAEIHAFVMLVILNKLGFVRFSVGGAVIMCNHSTLFCGHTYIVPKTKD